MTLRKYHKKILRLRIRLIASKSLFLTNVQSKKEILRFFKFDILYLFFNKKKYIFDFVNEERKIYFKVQRKFTLINNNIFELIGMNRIRKPFFFTSYIYCGKTDII